jgi:hypothetical protein
MQLKCTLELYILEKGPVKTFVLQLIKIRGTPAKLINFIFVLFELVQINHKTIPFFHWVALQ